MTLLDERATYQRLDPGGMGRFIRELPQSCLTSWQEVQGVALPDSYRQVDHIVVAGMGGSAIAGDLVRGLVEPECRVPFQVVRDYRLPAYVNERTLVIASSYSGSTEETLACVDDALARRSKLIAITSGGRVAEIAAAQGFPMFRIAYEAPPRATLGFSLPPMLALLGRLGLISDQSQALQEAVRVMERALNDLGPDTPTARNLAKQIATRLHGKLPIIYGAGFLAGVARRWKTQINENSKSWAEFEELPELHHNAVVGYPQPADLRDRLYVVLLRSSLLHPRTLTRYRITEELLSRNGIPFETVEAQGQSALAHLLSSVLVGDHVSYYLAMLNETDPMPVAVIDYLKGELARS